MRLRRRVRELRIRLARLPDLGRGLPQAPALTLRDPWPGDPARGARLLKGELAFAGSVRPLKPGTWCDPGAPEVIRAHAHGFLWLRDLRALGTDGARMRARALVADWLAGGGGNDTLTQRPDVVGARIAAWFGHWDFFAASAEDGFRHRLIGRIVTDARRLALHLPTEEVDVRALTAIRGVLAASVSLPEHANHLARALRFLPQELARGILGDGVHAERSPRAQLRCVQELVEMRGILQAGRVPLPAPLPGAIERAALALRSMRHGDGALALFNGAREGLVNLVDLVLAQAGRGARPIADMREGGFQRLQAGRTLIVVDCGAPPGPGLDAHAHAGTLAMEMSVGRERLVVNCGAAPVAAGAWTDAARATAAHSTLVIGDTSSSELVPGGLGRKPERVEVQRQEANGAHWLEASHDGYRRPFGAVHRRRLYLAESGEDVRGEDSVEAATPLPYALRFHLHPSVSASLQQDGEAVLLRLPSGGGWRLRAEGARMALEESIYLGGFEPRRTEQVVLTGLADGPQLVKWAITKVG